MRKRNNSHSPRHGIKDIQGLIDALPPDAENQGIDTYINIIHNEFQTFEGKISIPRIPVTELDYHLGHSIMKDLVTRFPRYLKNHRILEKRIPEAEQHFLHFRQKLEGKCIDFSHMFKIDLKFGGNPETITEKGNTDYYPAFNTERLYYKSHLVPESTVHRLETDITMDPIRIREVDEVDSDQFFHTFAIFDEADRSKVTETFYQALALPGETFTVSPSLFSFIEYNYFTACFNVIDPVPEEVSRAIEIFEPLFLLLYGRVRNLKGIVNDEAVNDFFGDLLKLKGTTIEPTEKFLSLLRDYFSRYKLVRDDDMVIKGWWKFEEI